MGRIDIDFSYWLSKVDDTERLIQSIPCSHKEGRDRLDVLFKLYRAGFSIVEAAIVLDCKGFGIHMLQYMSHTHSHEDNPKETYYVREEEKR